MPINKQIIIVDDCSRTARSELLREMAETNTDLTIVFHEVNQGKGAALRTGFKHATGDVVIVQDADLEYEPEQYPELFSPSSRKRRRRLRLAVHRRETPRALLLAPDSQQGPDTPF